MSRRLLSPKEIQNIFNIGKTKAYELFAHGIFPRIKVGSRTFTTVEAADRYYDRLLKEAEERRSTNVEAVE